MATRQRATWLLALAALATARLVLAEDKSYDWKFNIPKQPSTPEPVECGTTLDLKWSSGRHDVVVVPGSKGSTPTTLAG